MNREIVSEYICRINQFSQAIEAQRPLSKLVENDLVILYDRSCWLFCEFQVFDMFAGLNLVCGEAVASVIMDESTDCI